MAQFSKTQGTHLREKKGYGTTHFARGKYFVKWDYYVRKPVLLPAARGTITQPVFVLYTLKNIIRKPNKHAEHV